MKKYIRSKKSLRIQTNRQNSYKKATLLFVSNPRQKHVRKDKFADLQLNWLNLIPTLEKRAIIKWEKVERLSVMGDAPKDFITDREDQLQFKRKSTLALTRSIAKVGSKFYPLESIIEQLITRIGQAFRLNIAESKLRIVEGQVRFMSKYFLKREEQLTHGAEILRLSLDDDNYGEIERTKQENLYFSFQMVVEAIQHTFPDDYYEITEGLVEMLTFDCIIGHNDRHPYNWGVVMPLKKSEKARFSPIYDTARALFWNKPENTILKMLNDLGQLEAYIRKCVPPFSWDKEINVDFFRLIGLIYRDYDCYRLNIDKLLSNDRLADSIRIIETEFSRLMSTERSELIKRCLRLRYEHLTNAVNESNIRR